LTSGNYHVIISAVLEAIPIVFTARTVPEAALVSVFVAMARDPEGFAMSNAELNKHIK